MRTVAARSIWFRHLEAIEGLAHTGYSPETDNDPGLGTRHVLRSARGFAIAAAALVLLAGDAGAQAASRSSTSASHASLETLGFMTGCWRGAFGGAANPGTIEEYYSTPTSNMIIGATRFVRGGHTVDFEFTRITAGDSGIVLMPQPRGRPPTPFRMTASDSMSAVWENPQHDFPQRISYRRISADSIVASIAGPGQGGRTQTMEWRMGKVRCGEP